MNISPSFTGYINVCSSYRDSHQCYNRGNSTSKATDDEFIKMIAENEVNAEKNEVTGSFKQALVDFFKKNVDSKLIPDCDDFFSSDKAEVRYDQNLGWFDFLATRDTNGLDKTLLFQYSLKNN